jgi:hypothetical protein
VIESKNRQPIGVLKIQYSSLLFDSDGMMEESGETEVRLAMEMLEPVITDKDKQVVYARHKFALKR